jgi:hypothetical protein
MCLSIVCAPGAIPRPLGFFSSTETKVLEFLITPADCNDIAIDVPVSPEVILIVVGAPFVAAG